MVAAASLLMILLILRFPDMAISASRTAITVWGRDVVPSLFPYMVLCKTTASRLSAGRLPVVPLTVALGWLGGSPSGAAMLSASAGRLERRQLHALSALTGTISPMFFLGTMRTWGLDGGNCLRLLLAHWMGAAFACLCVWHFSWINDAPDMPQTAKRTENPIVDSVQAVMGVGGCIVFFSVLASCIGVCLPFLSEEGVAGLHALLEIAGGLRAWLNLRPLSLGKLVCVAALTGFGGFSILAQNRLFLQPCGITQFRLMGFACLRAIGAGAAMLIFCLAR